MKKHAIGFPIFVIAAALFFLLCTVGVFADGESGETVPHASVSLSELAFPYVIDNIGAEASEWYAGKGVSAVTSADELKAFPFEPFSGLRALAVRTASDEANGSFETERRFVFTPLDLSDFKCLYAAVNVPESFGCSCTLSVTLISSDNSSLSRSFSVPTGDWCGIVDDISAFSDRRSIKAIRFSLEPGAGYSPSSGSSDEQTTFWLDYLSASQSSDPMRLMNFLTDDFYSYGGYLTESEENGHLIFNVRADAASPFIETASNDFHHPGAANAFELTFSENAGAESVTCYYTTETVTEYSEECCSIFTIPAGETGTVHALFRIDSDYVGKLRFVFNGAKEGRIELHSLRPVSVLLPSEKSPGGSVDLCRLSENGRDITVAGTLNEEAEEYYRGMKLLLFALDPSADVNSSALRSLSPVAQTNVSSDFSFKISLSSNEYAPVYSKYVAAIRDPSATGGYFLIDSEKYVSNPEQLSTVQTDETTLSSLSLKGFSAPDAASDPARECGQLGGSRLLIPVDLSDLVSLTPTDLSLTADGTSYYYSEAFVSALDKAVNDNKNCGAETVFQLVVSRSGSTALDSLMISPDAALTSERGEKYCAFNVSDEEGTAYLFSSVLFLAKRYSGNIAGFVFGSEIERAWENYSCGQKELRQFTEDVVRAFRVVITAARCGSPHSGSSSVPVYLSVGKRWDEGTAHESTLAYDGRLLLAGIASAIANQGGISWNISFDPFDSVPAPDETSARRLDEVCTLLNSPSMAGSRYVSSLLLLSKQGPGKIGFDPDDNNQINEESADSANRLLEYCALFRKAGEERNSGKNRISPDAFIIPSAGGGYTDEILLRIDTESGKTAVDELLALCYPEEQEQWEERFGEESGEVKTVTHLFLENEVASSLPAGIRGFCTIGDFAADNFSEKWFGWNTAASPSVIYLSDHGELLSAELTKGSRSGGVGIRFDYPRNFAPTPCLSFEMQASVSSAVSSAEAVFTLYSGNDCAVFRTAVEFGEWKRVCLDLSSFEKIDQIDRMTAVLSSDGETTDLGSATLLIGKITGHSAEYSSEELTAIIEKEAESNRPSENAAVIDRRVITAVAIVGLLAIIAEAAYIAARIVKNHKVR